MLALQVVHNIAQQRTLHIIGFAMMHISTGELQMTPQLNSDLSLFRSKVNPLTLRKPAARNAQGRQTKGKTNPATTGTPTERTLVPMAVDERFKSLHSGAGLETLS